MKATYIPRIQTNSFTEQQLLLSENQKDLQEYIGLPFSKEAFNEQIKLKSENYNQTNRTLLYKVLKSKYDLLDNNSKSLENIEKLLDIDCFTITTGHQLCLLTGPIFFIYKILHVIKQCEELNKSYPEHKFVPIYWMASEDHDFEEIASVELFNQYISWVTNQSGPVGRFETTGFDELHEQFKAFFQPENRGELEEYLSSCKGKDLADATFNGLNHLFQDFGLVIMDGDDPALKTLFVPTLRKELTEKFSFREVNRCNEQLIKEGNKIQVNPREINLFYLEAQARERILPLEDGCYIEGRGRVETNELVNELDHSPEKFSPNVILRPLYQEFLLPNLVYVGGVNELNYWLQLKGTFSEAGITFPMICARASFLYIDPIASKRMSNLELVLENLFMDISLVKKHYLLKNAGEEIQFVAEDEAFFSALEKIKSKIKTIDIHLEKYAVAETAKMSKQYASVKEKLQRTVKNKHEVSMKQIEQLFERLFPNGIIQERQIGFFSLCSDGKISKRLKQIYDAIEPFDLDFVILRDSK